MENTTQLFLAVRFNCNKCHDHPFERWTQDQYYQLAAYFAQVGRKEDPKFKGQKIGGTAVEGAVPLVEIIDDAKAGEVKHDPHRRRSPPPKFPFTHRRHAADRRPAPRAAGARGSPRKDNPYFAKSYVNRLWSYLLGVGIIEPVDDIRAGNPPTNPELLDRLTEEFVDSGFDVQQADHARSASRARISIRSRRTSGTRTTTSTTRTPSPGGCRPRCCSTRSTARPARESQLPGLPPGARAAQLLDSQRRAAGRLPRPVRQAAARERLRVRTHQRHDARAGAEPGQRPGRRRRHRGPEQPHRQARRRPRRTTPRWSRELYLAILCRPPTEQGTARSAWPRCKATTTEYRPAIAADKQLPQESAR